MSWISDQWNNLKGNVETNLNAAKGSSLFTGAGTPWGGGKDQTSWDPLQSGLGTGKGTPWSAGNKTSPLAYAMPVAMGIFGSGLDTGGEQRNAESAAKQKDQEDAARQASEAAAAQQAAADKQAGIEKTAGQNLGQQNSLEQQMMDTYRKRQAGQNLY